MNYYFYILDKIDLISASMKKRELKNQGYKIDPTIKEYYFFHNSSVKFKRSILIILVFSLIGILAKNSNEQIIVFGIEVIVWKFSILLSIIIASRPIYQIFTNKKPSIIINNDYIKFKNKGIFEWSLINDFKYEIENSIDDTNENNNLVLKYNKVWYRMCIDEMNTSKEKIESIVDFYLSKRKNN